MFSHFRFWWMMWNHWDLCRKICQSECLVIVYNVDRTFLFKHVLDHSIITSWIMANDVLEQNLRQGFLQKWLIKIFKKTAQEESGKKLKKSRINKREEASPVQWSASFIDKTGIKTIKITEFVLHKGQGAGFS